MANETLGVITCESKGCGGWADVLQAGRGKGRYLYTNCGNVPPREVKPCGITQKTGGVVQRRLWHETEWRSLNDEGVPLDAGGSLIKFPPPIKEGEIPMGSSWLRGEPKEPSVNAGLDDSAVQPNEEPIAKKPPKKSGKSGWIGAALVAAFLGGLSLVLAEVKGNG